MVTLVKICSKCRLEKIITEFYKSSARHKDGVLPHCKKCHKEFYSYSVSAGVPKEIYLELFRQQEGRCKICQHREKLVVDHDHHTGKVRGLLCRECNQGLGLFYDSVAFLERAITYLKAPQTDIDYRAAIYTRVYSSQDPEKQTNPEAKIPLVS